MFGHAYRLRLAVLLTVSLGAASRGRAADVVPLPSAGCAAASIEKGRPLQKTIEVDGVTRAYLLDVPEGIDAKKPVPLLFDFHGLGHSAAGVWRVSKFRDLAATDGFITVYPDGLPVNLRGSEGAGWEIFSIAGNRDLAFTTQLLDYIERTYCIDRARIFSAGFSNGAFFSNLLGCVLADRFAAIAPVGGGQLTVPCQPKRGVPVIIHHGRKDARIEVQQARSMRDAWIEKNQCRDHASNGCEWHRECRDGAEVEYCEDDSEHYWPEPATKRIWEFFKKHPMPSSSPSPQRATEQKDRNDARPDHPPG